MKKFISFAILIIILLVAGCSIETVSTKDTRKIIVTSAKYEQVDGNLLYNFTIKNNSSYSIKQNAIYFSYNIKTKNGVKSNPFKIEAKGNKIEVKPKENVTVSVVVPKDVELPKDSWDIEHPNLEMKGFLKEVKKENHFHKTLVIEEFDSK